MHVGNLETNMIYIESRNKLESWRQHIVAVVGENSNVDSIGIGDKA